MSEGSSIINNEEKILNFLKDIRKEVSLKELSEKTGVSQKNISGYWKKLEKNGFIKSNIVQDGKLRIVYISYMNSNVEEKNIIDRESKSKPIDEDINKANNEVGIDSQLENYGKYVPEEINDLENQFNELIINKNIPNLCKKNNNIEAAAANNNENKQEKNLIQKSIDDIIKDTYFTENRPEKPKEEIDSSSVVSENPLKEGPSIKTADDVLEEILQSPDEFQRNYNVEPIIEFQRNRLTNDLLNEKYTNIPLDYLWEKPFAPYQVEITHSKNAGFIYKFDFLELGNKSKDKQKGNSEPVNNEKNSKEMIEDQTKIHSITTLKKRKQGRKLKVERMVKILN